MSRDVFHVKRCHLVSLRTQCHSKFAHITPSENDESKSAHHPSSVSMDEAPEGVDVSRETVRTHNAEHLRDRHPSCT